MKPESAASVVLSAGPSQRVGDFKLLMMLGGMTILERVIRLFQSVGVRRIHVVVDHRASELIPLIDRWGARSVLDGREKGGLGALLARMERHAVDVAVVDEFIHQDMDRPEDYKRLENLSRAAGTQVPINPLSQTRILSTTA